MIRYPGGKLKLKKHILPIIKTASINNNEIYIEPFLGSGSIASSVISLSCFDKYILNDKDYGVMCIWNSIISNKDELISNIREVIPSVDLFYEFKDKLSNNKDYLVSKFSIVDIAVMKMAVHQFSYSGLGLRAGGPIGGKNQKSNYSVGCRWNANNLIKKIESIYELLSYNDISNSDLKNIDFEEVLFLGESFKGVYYLDPPYYEQGNSLYIHGFSHNDHKRLNTILKNSKNKWILSYDNHEYIREAYNWANIEEVSMKCTINGANVKKELLISNFNY